MPETFSRSFFDFANMMSHSVLISFGSFFQCVSVLGECALKSDYRDFMVPDWDAGFFIVLMRYGVK